MANGDDVTRAANIQVRAGEGDEARVSYSMLVPVGNSKTVHLCLIKMKEESGVINQI